MYAIANKLEGPLSLPFIGCSYLLYGDNYDILIKLIKIALGYKGIVRLWLMNKLLLINLDPKYNEIILNHPKCLAKADIYKYLAPILGSGLLTAPVPKWKKQRKLISPTFNQKVLDSFVESFVKYSNILVEQLEENCRKENPDDIQMLITRCTFDIICENGMGVHGIEAQKNKSKFGYHLDKSIESTFLRMTNIFYQFDFLFKQTQHWKHIQEAVQFFREFTLNIINEKRLERQNEKQNKLKDGGDKLKKTAFLNEILNIPDSEEKFSNEDLYAEIMTFAITGSDTTGFTVCFVMLMLAMHPKIQETVLEEVIDVIGSNGSIKPELLPKLKYLERVIKETLRLFPIGIVVLRETEGDVDLKDGIVIPDGCTIAIPILLIHRSPDYWPNPLQFNPDRFLSTEKIIPYTYLPFSGGPRMCLGPHYGMMSMKTIIATLIRSFTVTTKYKCVEEVEITASSLIRLKNGFQLTFQPRGF